MLLSRVADRIYWAARYIERAEDTARHRARPRRADRRPAAAVATRWEPLVAIVGSDVRFRDLDGQRASVAAVAVAVAVAVAQSQSQSHGERRRRASAVARFLVADREQPEQRRQLRRRRPARTCARPATRVPREAGTPLNDLYLYVTTEADRGADRRVRERFLTRVIADSRRLDGILATAMTHDEAYVMWRLGRAIERADMTTRVLGVRAAAVLSAPPATTATARRTEPRRGAVDGRAALAVRACRCTSARCAGRSRARPSCASCSSTTASHGPCGRCCARSAGRSPSCPIPARRSTPSTTSRPCCAESTAASTDGAALDDAMDALQVAIAQLDKRDHRPLPAGRACASAGPASPGPLRLRATP